MWGTVNHRDESVSERRHHTDCLLVACLRHADAVPYSYPHTAPASAPFARVLNGLVWGYWDSTSSRLWNILPKFIINLSTQNSSNPFIPPPSHIIHHTSNLPHHTSNLIPPTSYIKPQTSHFKHHTSYLIHRTSYIFNTTPALMHTLLLNASFFQRRSVSVYPIFFKTRIAINYPEIIFFEHKWREWLDKSRWNL